MPESPFVGLAPYSEADESFFFAREREVRLLVASLFAARLTLLYGSSGAGKSSTLRAGVLPELRRKHESDEEAPAFVYHSSWHQPDILKVFYEAAQHQLAVPDNGSCLSLHKFLVGVTQSTGRDVFLILDHFEEFLQSYNLFPEAAGFASALADVVNDQRLPVNTLVVLREDALARIDIFKKLIPNLFANYYRLDPLTRSQAQTAILSSVDAYNRLLQLQGLSSGAVVIEPELLSKVLDQVCTGTLLSPGVDNAFPSEVEHVDAAYLQLVMVRLWQEDIKRGSFVLRSSTLDALGGSTAIVRDHLFHIFARFDELSLSSLCNVLRHLVTPTGNKIAHTAADLAALSGVDRSIVDQLLAALSAQDSRIIAPLAPSASGNGEVRYQLFHDTLASAVLAWTAEFSAAQAAKKAEFEAASQYEARLDAERAIANRRQSVLKQILAVVSFVAIAVLAILLARRTFEQSRLLDLRAADELMRGLSEQLDRAAKATAPLDAEQLVALRNARGAAAAVMDRLLVVGDSGFLGEGRVEREWRPVFAAWAQAFRYTGTQRPEETETSFPRSARAIDASIADSQLRAAVGTAWTALAVASERLRSVDIGAPAYGNEPGRLLATLPTLVDHFDPARYRLMSAERRLPERLKDWKGMVDPETHKPFDYDSRIRNFKSFRGVGGGIHLGSTASLKGEPCTNCILTYDPVQQALVLISSAGHTYRLGSLDPSDLKALYRYASSGANAAISIGWSGNPEDAVRPLERDRPVLLDPFLVDTSVGQQLFLADTLPWRLDQPTFPNGARNPISAPFSVEVDRLAARRADQVALIRTWIEQGPQVSDLTGEKWTARLRAEGGLGTLIALVLRSRSGDEFLAKVANQPGRSPELRQILKQVALRINRVGQYGAALMLALSALNDDRVDRIWIEVASSLLKSKLETDDARAALIIYRLLPLRSLAVLLDEPTTIELRNGRVYLTNSIRYRFVTKRFRAEQERIVMVEPDGTEVEDLIALNKLVNGALPQLKEAFAPLARAQFYAQIVALLRWAIQPGGVRGIDLSYLGNFRSRDQVAHRTPDALE